jgi:hypothetical protein
MAQNLLNADLPSSDEEDEEYDPTAEAAVMEKEDAKLDAREGYAPKPSKRNFGPGGAAAAGGSGGKKGKKRPMRGAVASSEEPEEEAKKPAGGEEDAEEDEEGEEETATARVKRARAEELFAKLNQGPGGSKAPAPVQQQQKPAAAAGGGLGLAVLMRGGRVGGGGGNGGGGAKPAAAAASADAVSFFFLRSCPLFPLFLSVFSDALHTQPTPNTTNNKKTALDAQPGPAEEEGRRGGSGTSTSSGSRACGRKEEQHGGRGQRAHRAPHERCWGRRHDARCC